MADAALRFLHYAALLGLFGWTAYRSIGLRGRIWTQVARRGAALITAAVAALLVSAALELVSIAAMMGMPVETLDWPVIEAMLLGTDMGWAFLIRIGLLLAAMLALVTSRTALAALCYAAALMTLGWSGHAAASDGWLGLSHRLNNGVHLLAIGLWLGAIGWFLRLTRLAHRRDGRVSAPQLLAVMHGFAPLGVLLVGTAVLTGIINAQLIFGLENSATVLTTPYGRLLAAKIVLVTGMMGFGARNAGLGRRHAAKTIAIDEVAVLRALRASLAGELAFGVAVVALVAVLGMMSPMTMG